MQGVAPAITIRRSVPSRELRDLLDRRRNWLFANPESLPGGPNTSDPSTTLEELQKGDKRTAMEQYYFELTRQQNDTSARKEPTPADAVQRQDDTVKLPPALREREQELKRLLTIESDNEKSADLLSGKSQEGQQQPGARSIILPLSPSNVEAKRQTPVDQYRELLGLPTTALAVADLFKVSGGLPERQSSTVSPIPQTPSTPVVLPTLRSLGSQAGLAPEAPTAAEAPRAPMPTTPGTATAKADVPKRTPPPTPTFTAPRRMF